jgi:peroxiredoxin
MQFPRGRLYWMLLVVLLVVTFASSMSIYFRRPYSGSIEQSTGRKISTLSVKDEITGDKVVIPSKRLTFLFYYNLSSPQNLQDITYAAYLLKTQHPNDVDFVVVTGGHFQQLEQMRREKILPFPLIVDSSFSIARQLTIPNTADRSFIIRQDGTLLFAPQKEAFGPEDIRELYELYTHGNITYASGPPSANEIIGKPFPNILLKELHTNRQSRLFDIASPGDSQLLIFTASCPACTLESFLRGWKGEFRAAKTIPIITSRVPEIELRQIISNSGISSPIYMAQSEIQGIEDLYFDFGAKEGSVLLISTNKSGVTQRVEALP